uniref:acylglycerol lipase n=1 Tax=Arion vulgaris TaxID=1028688 RepID=A0A0B7B0A4_9EUPU
MAAHSEVHERKVKGKKSNSQKASAINTISSTVTEHNKDEPKVGGDNSPEKHDSNNVQQSIKKRASGKEKTNKGTSSLFTSFCSKMKYVLLLIFIPPFLNFASLQREAVDLKPAGELYDIGWGQKLLLSCQGKGPPTVLLDAPTGMNSDVWTLVVAKLAEHANVCVYDRAGLGFSDRPMNRSVAKEDTNIILMEQSNHFTVERMVDDLHKLISESSQQPRPLILVGAELGALIAQFYTHVYESDVLGLVLINPLNEDLFQQSDKAWVQHWFGSLNPTYQTLQLGAALGITRLGLLIGALKQPITGDFVPDEVILRQKYLLCHPRHLSSIVDEHHFINESFSQMRTLRKIKPLASHISVSVLTGNYYDEQMPSALNKAWARAEQNLLSKLPPYVQHLVVNGADRHIMYRKPESIAETVLKLIRKWKRTNTFSDSRNA